MKPDLSGTVVLGFGPQPLDFLSKASKMCGSDAVLNQDVARMAGATFAIGPAELFAELRQRLEIGALIAQRQETPTLSLAATTWLASGSRGISSNTMFTVMTGVDALRDGYQSHPHDPDDFDRCLKLLHAVPELRLKLPLMARASPAWAALVEHWDEIERSHLDEVGLGWTKAGNAPRTYELMKKVLRSAE